MTETLHDLVADAGNVAHWLRNRWQEPSPPSGVPAEFSNWRDEQWAWDHSAALFDLTDELVETRLSGADAASLIGGSIVNSSQNWKEGEGRHCVATNFYGRVIGDGVICRLAEDRFIYTGRSAMASWLEYRATVQSSGIEVARTPALSGQARFQIHGPRAADVVAALGIGDLGSMPSRQSLAAKVGGSRVTAARIDRGGRRGLEIAGPRSERVVLREAIMQAGKSFGLVPVGRRAQASEAISGRRVPNYLPAIHTGELMVDFRKWLRADSREAGLTLGGSFVSDVVDDYYCNPWELGFGKHVCFDHDFPGCETLKDRNPDEERRPVLMRWRAKDVKRLWTSMLAPGGEQYKFFALPVGGYADCQYDALDDADGNTVGLSFLASYDWNRKAVFSLATVDHEVPQGVELDLIWGERAGGTEKACVEPHRQMRVKATVEARL
ncbi:aminomethyltransferase family protein [Aurantiacibacter spongiae]|uniref:Aminomethyl transferase family protein n=1 Tax=Aurantiacibacter spongiae TaxID=2488860 RepID=A0A3N5CTM8_9SPHN|nr:aminomethyl transferase family protein [Aurantiacibacter spongiae]RPF71656.1 aminomethyl transferase family protein [Aurantiacibacter spongiae]